MLPYLDLQDGPRVCTSLFLMRRDRILVGLRHYEWQTPDGPTLWTTPGGRCGPHETVCQNLRREAKEETGITDFKLTGFVGVMLGAKPGDILFVYAGRTWSDPQLMEPHKFSVWRWLRPSKIRLSTFINPTALKRFIEYNRPML